MNFGLLCDDPTAATLIAALGRQSEHALTIAVLVSPRTDSLLHGLAGVKFTDRWEDLLAARQLDAVIVGGEQAEVWDAARQLAANSLPLIVFPTMAHGPAIFYELSLIRDDRRGVIFPVWRHRFDAALRRLRDELRIEKRTSVAFVKWEQTLPLGAGTLLPTGVIEEHLLHAADQFRYLFGAPDYVTTLQTGGTEHGALIQSVVLAGRTVPELTWTIQSGDTTASRLTLQTPDGPWRYEWDAARSEWCGNFSSENRAGEDRWIPDVVAAVSGEVSPADWSTMLHAAEIVDAAKRSLERRRTIDLNHEPLSERVIFKSQMAAMGCSLLLLTLGLMLGLLLIDSVVPLNRTLLKWLLLLAATPMFGFLLFQLLLPLTRTAGDENVIESPNR